MLTMIYAEKGRGKTALSAILRSLSPGDATPISDRRRPAAQHGALVKSLNLGRLI